MPARGTHSGRVVCTKLQKFVEMFAALLFQCFSEKSAKALRFSEYVGGIRGRGRCVWGQLCVGRFSTCGGSEPVHVDAGCKPPLHSAELRRVLKA